MQATRICLALLAFTLGACVKTNETRIEDVTRRAQETLETTLTRAQAKKDAYTKRLRDRLAAVNTQLDDLQERATQLSRERKEHAHAELTAQLEKLQTQKAALEDKLARLKETSGDAWESAKDGLDNALEELQAGLAEAKKKLE